MTRERQKLHGLAYAVVLVVIGMATLVGWAMLSNASLQALVTNNSAQLAAADYLTESALQTATYYLQRDLANMPTSWGATAGHAIRAQNVTVSGVAGSFDIDAVATSTPNEYTVSAVGRSSGSTAVTRSSSATIRVVRTTPTFAAGFGGPVTINGRTYVSGGEVVAAGAVNVIGGATVSLNSGSRTSFTSTEFAVPASLSGNIRYYGGNISGGTYTTPSGAVGTPQFLSSGTITSTASLTANAGNPGKVFYYSSNVYIKAAGTYDGTIIARGRIEISPPLGSTVTFNRQPGFPALVADGTLYVNSRSLNCNINGVVWAGTGAAWNTGTNVTGSNLRINGALLMPSNQTIGASGQGTFTLNYTSANTDVLNLTTATQPGIGIQYVSFSE